MTRTYVALLRAVNVGGTGKLPMANLKALCEAAGFERVRSWIASGNVVFQSSLAAPLVKAALELRLAAYAGKPVGVAIRTPQQLAEVLANNPFAHAPPNRTVAIFLDQPPGASALQGIAGQAGEEIAIGRCEIYVLYGASMAQSKLRIPAAKAGTARNMNTLLKLCNMANAAVTAAAGPKRR